ncbi:cation:proton antiporter regulatory subunit [Haladaptatus salinisoli]|uniref:cation:proton antiporter regulatory subunit n=1 Tax=Haladaptatus salinisoli TaxID=2884876 RepID=UPI001D0A130D|nr:TrkA C-terminal domain-containing protein [Haladaptatus salinisoli]
MKVYETSIPGVGRKYELDRGTDRLVVLLRHDGERELYRRMDDENEKLLDLAGAEARKLATILAGGYFQPVEHDAVELPLGDAIIEWVDVTDASPLSGSTLDEAAIRGETGATVIAVQRARETHPAPDSDFEVRGDDALVAVGTREELADLARLAER